MKPRTNRTRVYLLRASFVLFLASIAARIGTRSENRVADPFFGTCPTFLVEAFSPNLLSPSFCSPFCLQRPTLQNVHWTLHGTNTDHQDIIQKDGLPSSVNATLRYEDVIDLFSNADFIDVEAKNRLIESLKDRLIEESPPSFVATKTASAVEKENASSVDTRFGTDKGSKGKTICAIPTVEGRWEDSGDRFHSTRAWQTTPLLMRGAFVDDLSDTNGEGYPFPTWTDILDLACSGGKLYDEDHEDGPYGEYIGPDEDDEDDDVDENYGMWHEDDDEVEQDGKDDDGQGGDYFQWDEEDDDDSDSAPSRLIQYSWPQHEEMDPDYYHDNVNTDWLDTFEINQFGPFADPSSVEKLLKVQEKDHDSANLSTARTLLVNDVDRWFPDLSDWMDKRFNNNLNGNRGVIPARWRRDDAQISLSYPAGGIGPHVDDYDVFLIQLAGERTWDVLWEDDCDDEFESDNNVAKISVRDETDCILPESSMNGVRILNVTKLQSLQKQRCGKRKTKLTRLHLSAGDCLYLPPRVLHCGTASAASQQQQQRCMTLSVGCRAPSAKELLGGLSHLIENAAAVGTSKPMSLAMPTFPTDTALESYYKRFTSTESNDGVNHGEHQSEISQSPSQSSWLSPEVKNEMKNLILDAVQTALDDDENILDPLVGKFVTRSNRLEEEFAIGGDDGPSFSYPKPFRTTLVNRDEQDEFLNVTTTLAEIFGPTRNVHSKSDKNAILRRSEGIAFAWSSVYNKEQRIMKYRLYAQGRPPLEVFEMSMAPTTDEELNGIPEYKVSAQDSTVGKLLNRIANGPPLDRAFVVDELDISIDFNEKATKHSLAWLLLELVEAGLLYVRYG